MRAFRTAWQTGDLAALVGVLDPDATAITDGGGLVSASLVPLHGPQAIAGFLLSVWNRQPDLVVDEELVNGEPGLVATDRQGHILAVLALPATGPGRISHVWVVRNPGKLEGWRRGPTGRSR
ncbi:nuclear transport factor 2 family protein [Micromonospora sp. NPDC048894]|uniref:nuclear transport factor 2 family protein n=1 Tax=unclassified Micromonospora TaxID=2617518 RepID=UPI0033FD9E49